MLVFFPSEEFEELDMGSESLKLRYAISNFGRLISYTDEFEDGRLLKGSTTQGYRIFRYKIRTHTGKLKHFHKFFYQMVAEHFVSQPSDDHQYVIHVDFNKENDFYKNLKWVTKEEMYEHMRNNPNSIAGQKRSHESRLRNGNGTKLSSTQVMHIKKRLQDPNRKTRMKLLAKQFGISEMQLYRIKSGENWGHIKVLPHDAPKTEENMISDNK